LTRNRQDAPIRLLHVLGTLEIGGEQRYVARLAQRLDPLRFTQTVAYSNNGTMRAEFPPHVRFVRMTEHRPRAVRLGDWDLVRRYARVIREDNIDLVTTHGAGFVQIAAAMAAKRWRRPVVHTIQRPWFNRSRTEDMIVKIPGLRYVAYALTDKFVALGSYYHYDQISRFKIPAGKMHLSYIGIDISEFRDDRPLGAEARRELGIPLDAPLVVIVARHSPVKGINRGLACFAALRKVLPAARLLSVGDGPTRAEHEAKAAELGITSAVTFAGARTDTVRMMNAGDVLMQTTYNPLNGISSIEGMAVARPIVTVVEREEEERMAADTCDEQRNGLFFRMIEMERSAARLADLLGDAPRMQRMGGESRRMAEERFEIDRHIRDLEDLYLRLLGRSE